ncbi:MAG: TonB-dependent receptor [Gemmatimonadales bacterium]
MRSDRPLPTSLPRARARTLCRLLLVLAGLLGLVGRPAAAQAVLEGTVRDSATGGPVGGAVITLVGTTRRAVSDAGGRFHLGSPPPGRYLLRARAVGFRPPSDRPVSLGTDRVAVEVTLAAMPPRLPELIVTPSRFGVATRRPAAAATLNRSDLETLPQIGEDLYRGISRLPGLSSYDYSARFWVRGAPDDQVLARLDGVDLIEPFHLKDFDGALSIVDIETIGELTLTTGGFTAEYGDHLAGVLDLRTRSEPSGRTRGSVSLSASSVRAGGQGDFAAGRGRWQASARRGYLDLLLDLIGREEQIDPRYYDVGGKVEFQATGGHRFSAHFLRAGDALRYQSGTDPVLESRYGSTYGWLGWQAAIGADLTAETVASVAGLAWDRTGRGAFGGRDSLVLADHRTLVSAALRQDWTASVGRSLALRWGAEVRAGSADYDYLRWRERTAIVADALGRVRDTTAVAVAPSGAAVGVWLAPRMQPVGALTVEAGLRYDRQGWTGESTLSPRLNASLTVGSTTIRAAWGRYHQAQGLHQLVVSGRETAFNDAERAEHRVVGVEQRIGTPLRVRLEAYQRLSSNLRPQYVNLHDFTNPFADVEGDRRRLLPLRGRARGIELLTEYDGGGRLRWTAGYTLANAEQLIGADWVPRVRDERHHVDLAVTVRPSPGWLFTAAWQYHSGWPFTEQTFAVDTLGSGEGVLRGGYGRLYGTRLPAYHRLDLRATRRFSLGRGALRIFVDVFNAYARNNVVAYDYDVRLTDDVFEVLRAERKLLPIVPTFGVSWEF